MVYRDAAGLHPPARNLGTLGVPIDPSGVLSRRGTSNGTSSSRSTPVPASRRCRTNLDVSGYGYNQTVASQLRLLLDDVDGRTPYSRLEMQVALKRFLAWAEVEGIIEVADWAQMFSVRHIERFVQGGLPDYTISSKSTIRSRLMRVSELMLDPQSRRVRPLVVGPLKALPPYTDSEVREFHSWASSQTTPQRQRSATVLLALGLGAGLSASEIAEARRGDLAEVDGALSVTVRGNRPREVPFVSLWAAELSSFLYPDDDPSKFLFRPERTRSWPNVISNFSAGSLIRPQTQRLRATWVVAQLDQGTNVGVLVQAAGVDSLEAFTRYLPFLANVRDEDAREQLTGLTARLSGARASRG